MNNADRQKRYRDRKRNVTESEPKRNAQDPESVTRVTPDGRYAITVTRGQEQAMVDSLVGPKFDPFEHILDPVIDRTLELTGFTKHRFGERVGPARSTTGHATHTPHMMSGCIDTSLSPATGTTTA